MKKADSGASHNDFTPVIKMGNLGGGMSATENRMVNKRGKIIYNGGAPKATNDGKDLSKNAKNKVSGPAGMLIKEQSPSACYQSRNRLSKHTIGPGSNASEKGYK